MPRAARKQSASGIYHVMLRGINQQQIFVDEADDKRFLFVLRECKKLCGFELFAYCLMGNHIHLLLREGPEPLELIFKRIGCRFVYWYNLKYQRSGHLFQDRFRSEPVEDDRYFLTALRYIIQNPMKAGMEERPGTYPWTSFCCYSGADDGLTDEQMAIEMVGGRTELLAFLQMPSEDALLDLPTQKKGMSDEQAQIIMRSVTRCQTVTEFQALKYPVRCEMIRSLLEQGLSVRQVSRLTGLAKSTVDRCR